MVDTSLNIDIEESEDIFKELKDEKENVSITLDKKLIKELREYKDREKIKELSPMVNVILWDWMKKKGVKK